MNWYLKVLNQYADFNGRARRKEYWMFALFNIIVGFVLSFIDGVIGTFHYETGMGILGGIYSLGVIIPGLAVCVRRLHDIGKSGWMMLIVLIPIVGVIWLLVLMVTDSSPDKNQYGENPKGVKDSQELESFAVKNEQDYSSQKTQMVGMQSQPRLHCKIGNRSFDYVMNKPIVRIGRNNTNDVILDAKTVSRFHATIKHNGSEFELIDNNSSNKVIVNGRFVERTILRNSDIIGLGEALITFYL